MRSQMETLPKPIVAACANQAPCGRESIATYAKLAARFQHLTRAASAPFMNSDSSTTEKGQPQEPGQRRRSAPWILGGTVLLLLAIIVAQQAFNLWAVVPPDTGSDTLLLYALSSLNFAAFIVFTFILVRSVLKLRSRRDSLYISSP